MNRTATQNLSTKSHPYAHTVMKYVIPYTREVLYASSGNKWSRRLSQVAGGVWKIYVSIYYNVRLESCAALYGISGETPRNGLVWLWNWWFKFFECGVDILTGSCIKVLLVTEQLLCYRQVMWKNEDNVVRNDLMKKVDSYMSTGRPKTRWMDCVNDDTGTKVVSA